MSESQEEPKALFHKFIKAIKDEKSANILDKFLQKLEDNSLETALQNCDQITQIYNGDENSDSIDGIRKDIELSQKHINEVYYKIFDIENGEGERNSSSALKEIQNAKELANKLGVDYRRFYGTETGGNPSKGLITKLEEACNQIEDSQEQLDELNEYYDEIFNGLDNKKPLKEHLKNLEQNLQDLSKAYEQKFSELYKEKKGLIEDLMPSAASIGLAKAYQDEKNKIKRSITFWNCTFVGSTIIFILLFGGYFYLSFNENFSYISFLRALPLWIFSGFFSYYSTKQISEYKRLANEYAHKEALNTTYIAYKHEIENQENDEIKYKLQKIMLESAEFNPSNTLNKNNGEIPSVSILEKIIENMPIDRLKQIYDKIGSLIGKP